MLTVEILKSQVYEMVSLTNDDLIDGVMIKSLTNTFYYNIRTKDKCWWLDYKTLSEILKSQVFFLLFINFLPLTGDAYPSWYWMKAGYSLDKL